MEGDGEGRNIEKRMGWRERGREGGKDGGKGLQIDIQIWHRLHWLGGYLGRKGVTPLEGTQAGKQRGRDGGQKGKPLERQG